jgi:hypothetical protein
MIEWINGWMGEWINEKLYNQKGIYFLSLLCVLRCPAHDILFDFINIIIILYLVFFQYFVVGLQQCQVLYTLFCLHTSSTILCILI